jgi:alkanesulfonate monooxygenase SsuD/methylene tetrahydromethanopterin reductase-like flavin-dependent oxidoreductase (luciferase family)
MGSRLGIYFDLRNPPGWRQDWSRVYSFALELCEEAEHLGADSAWFSEHHMFEDGYLPQPLTFAAAAAARTKRIRIGTAVLIAPLRRSVHLAEEAAVVDILSDGRLDLGLGAGYRPPEFDAYGAEFGDRYSATDRMVLELRKHWAGGDVTPPPRQSPVPIWLGYGGPQGARRAGRLGAGLMSLRREQLEPYQRGLRDAGLDPGLARMTGPVQAWVSEDPDRDWPLVAKHHAYQWDSYRRYMVEGTGHPAPRPIDPDRSRANGLAPGLGNLLYATPDDAAERLRAHVRGLPVDTLLFWVSLAGMPEDIVARHVQTLCTRLRPLLTEESASA